MNKQMAEKVEKKEGRREWNSVGLSFYGYTPDAIPEREREVDTAELEGGNACNTH